MSHLSKTKFFIENLIEKIGHVVQEKQEFENRDESVLKPLFGFYILLCFWCRDQNGRLYHYFRCLRCKVFNRLFQAKNQS